MIPQLSALTVGNRIAERLRLGWSSRDYCISPLPREYPRLPLSPRPVVTPARPWYYYHGFHRGHTGPATAPLGPINEVTARGGGIPVATATPLAHRLFGELFTLPKSLGITPGTPPSPVRLFTHCGGFAPGASRRTSALVSVPIWGLPLSRPLPVLGLTGRYPANYLMGRRPPLGRSWEGISQLPFGNRGIPHPISYRGLSPVSRGYPLPEEELSTCYSAVRRDTLPGIPTSHGLVGGG